MLMIVASLLYKSHLDTYRKADDITCLLSTVCITDTSTTYRKADDITGVLSTVSITDTFVHVSVQPCVRSSVC